MPLESWLFWLWENNKNVERFFFSVTVNFGQNCVIFFVKDRFIFLTLKTKAIAVSSKIRFLITEINFNHAENEQLRFQGARGKLGCNSKRSYKHAFTPWNLGSQPSYHIIYYFEFHVSPFIRPYLHPFAFVTCTEGLLVWFLVA